MSSSSSLGDQAVGLLACFGSVLLFALFSLPTKTSQLGDGIFFQLLMCMGIFFVGAGVFLAQCAARPGGACAPLSPTAALGGAIWCLSNVLLTPIVKCIGVGPAMMAWGLNEGLIGWATGRFGLFGLRPEPVRDATQNSLGVALVVLSLCILAAVQPAVSDGSDKQPEGTVAAAESSSSSSSSSKEDAEERLLAPEEAAALAESVFEENGYDFTGRLSPLQRRGFGFAACVLAGLMSGSTFTPPQLVIDNQPAGNGLVLSDLLFSHFCGIAFSSVAVFMLYCAATRGRPWVRSAMVLPSLGAGLCWGLACTLWFTANEKLSLAISMPIITIGPGVLTMIIAAVAFREIRGARNASLASLSVAVYVAGASLVTASGGGD